MAVRSSREWIGGLLSPPFYVEEGADLSPAGVVVWMEAPSGLVVGHDVIGPGQVAGAVTRVLLTALKRPMAGAPRRPDRIRVADASLAAGVRAAVGLAIPVRVAPTPELDHFLNAMLDAMPDERSYLDGGHVSSTAVARLFTAAQLLWTVKPWTVAYDDVMVRMDIPALGVEGACVCIIGALGERRGLMIFPSLEACDAFANAAERTPPDAAGVDLGTAWLGLCLESRSDLSPAMRDEVVHHGWPVANPEAYPIVERWERDGTSRPLVERDVDIAAACATSLCSFFTKHEALFAADEIAPVCESFFDEHDLEVRFTLPYEAFPAFEPVDSGVEPIEPGFAAAPELPFQPKAARNAPCPCGSGRKYKKCHLPLDEAEHAATRGRLRRHALDGRLVHMLSDFAVRRFGVAWMGFDDFDDPDKAIQLAAPWSVYGFAVDGQTVVEAYLKAKGTRCSSEERAWLTAQQAAWLSVWEVIEIEPGASLTLCDLLSGETRHVREVSGSQGLVVRDALLARVVDHADGPLLCGSHPRPLPPFEAAEVVRRARGRLRRKRAVPVERLRDPSFGGYLIRRWEEAVAVLEARRLIPPVLRNTDDDPLLLTTDHFEIRPSARADVETRLAALEGTESPLPGEDPPVYTFLRSGSTPGGNLDSTVVGHARLTDTALQLETNSRTRADALRERVEAACGDRIKYRIREHTDPLSPKVVLDHRDAAPEPPPADADQIVLEFKQRHYATWPDEPLPALGGQTPRDAIGTPQGRIAVDVLLKDMENRERRAAGGAAFDFSELRRELRLD